MALDSIPPLASAASNPSSQINQQDFLKILLTQLTMQDPLKPMDNTAFVAQLAQFTQLQQTQELSSSMNQLVAVQTASQSIALLGRTVGLYEGGFVSSGQVTGVSVNGNAPVLTVRNAAGQDISGIERNQISDIK